MQNSLRRLAAELPWKPSIKFLGRQGWADKAKEPHEPRAHSEAPQSVQDDFANFGKGNSGESGKGVDTSKQAKAPESSEQTSKPAQSSSGSGSIEEWDLPYHLQRDLTSPSPEEIEAVDLGGATSILHR